MSDEFKTPPPFVRCPRCDGKGYYIEMDFDCTACDGTGWLPRWYTPEQWIEYVRRENDMPEYELPDDMPVWARSSPDSGYTQKQYKTARQYCFGPIVIATDAGRPPADWRPE